MAKEIAKIQFLIEVPYIAGVQDAGDIKIVQVHYSTCDSVNNELQAHGGLHTAENIPEVISTPELGAIGTEGTVLYKIAAIETAVKTKEGI